MPGWDWTNANLVSSIKRRASVPTVQNLFTVDDFLSLGDEELQNTIFPMIMSIKGDYFTANQDTVMTTATTYPIPQDAIGLKIKNLYWLQTTPYQRFVEITQLSQTDISRQFAGGWAQFGFYIDNNSIVLVPSGFSGQTLRIKYYKRASRLVPNEEGGQITAINTGTKQVTLATLPTAFAVNSLVSGIDNNPGFETKASSLTITAIASPVITLSDVSNLAVGYYICFDNESVIPQITVEAMPILAQSVAVKCLEAMNDPGLGNAQTKLGEIVTTFLATMTPRVDSQVPKVVQRSGPLAWKKINRYWGAK